ncbi:MAG: hypothetical protein P9L99_04270 [Candidatus Lernaella stagnicola]|nr:hypothetical protein [Candidatus Lernaella stagnicola]
MQCWCGRSFFLVVALLVGLSGCASLSAEPTVKYDSYRNVTTVSTGLLNFAGPLNTCTMSAHFSAEGRKPAAPEVVTFFFGAFSTDLRDTDNDFVGFLIDGERVEMSAQNVSSGPRDSSLGHSLTWIVQVSPELVRRLAEAKAASVKFGRFENTFTTKQQRSLAGLLETRER